MPDASAPDRSAVRSPASTIRYALAPGLALLALAACGHKAEERADTGAATVTFANPGNAENGGPAGNDSQSLAIQVPGFSAKFDVPGLSLGGADFKLDGMALAPGTRISGMKISGDAGDGSGGEGHGTVDAGFTSPQPPAQVIAYYKQAAPASGWTEVPPAAGQQFAATRVKDRGSEHLALSVGAAGSGSAGRFVVTGG